MTDLLKAREQMLAWLKEEKYAVKVLARPTQAQFEWELEVKVGALNMAVISMRDMPWTQIQCMIVLSDEHQTAYERLSTDEREAFELAIKTKLVTELPDFGINVNPQLQRFHVAVIRTLYPENLTRQSFMDSLRQTHHLGIAVLVIVADYLRSHHGVNR